MTVWCLGQEKGKKYLEMALTDWMMQIKKKNAKKIIIRSKTCRYWALRISNISYSSVASSILAKLLPYSKNTIIFHLLCFWTLNIVCMRYMCACTDKFSFISINIFSLSGSAFAMLSSLVEWRKKILLDFDFMNSIFIYCFSSFQWSIKWYSLPESNFVFSLLRRCNEKAW